MILGRLFHVQNRVLKLFRKKSDLKNLGIILKVNIERLNFVFHFILLYDFFRMVFGENLPCVRNPRILTIGNKSTSNT